MKPERQITRAEVATIFYRLLQDEARENVWSRTNSYSDVASGVWYNSAVSTLTNAGILTGYEDIPPGCADHARGVCDDRGAILPRTGSYR